MQNLTDLTLINGLQERSQKLKHFRATWVISLNKRPFNNHAQFTLDRIGAAKTLHLQLVGCNKGYDYANLKDLA